MLGGVTYFSYVLGSLIEMLSSNKSVTSITKPYNHKDERFKDLQNWIILLTRFRDNKPLPIKLE